MSQCIDTAYQASNQNEPTWGGRKPRAWQEAAYPLAIQSLRIGQRGIIRAATGGGKSVLAAEVIAWMVEQLDGDERIVVSAPTQKLIDQLAETLEARLPGLVGRYYQFHKDISKSIVVACHASLYRGEAFCTHCYPERVKPHGVLHKGDARDEMYESLKALAIGGDTSACKTPWQCHEHGREVGTVLGGLTRALRQSELSVRYWVADECHKTESTQPLGFAQWTAPEDIIGFTATPYRSDERDTLSLFDSLIYDYGPDEAIRDGVVMKPEIVHYKGKATDLDDACIEMIMRQLRRKRAHSPGVVSAYNIDDAEAFAVRLRLKGIAAEAIHSRLPKDAQADRIKDLQSGQLDCLVHVNMLAEGVDFPWLEWLCLRRQVGSRVRFCQEVGRVLRVYPGKTKAYVMDPNDLFGQLSLDYLAVLGGEDLPDIQTELDQLAAKIAMLFAESNEDSEPGQEDRYIAAMSEVKSWVRKTCEGLKVTGHIPRKITSTHWRGDEASSGQIGMLRGLVFDNRTIDGTKTMSESVRCVCREAVRAGMRNQFRKGDLSDLISMMKVVRDHGALPTIVDGGEV